MITQVPLPQWVTENAQRYLSHTVAGRSIRDLARDHACHPSTVLRQIRRIEMRRDDPLVDEVLHALSRFLATGSTNVFATGSGRPNKGNPEMSLHLVQVGEDAHTPLSQERFDRDAPRVLRRLCETGAVLALAADMEKAVIVRDGAGGSGARTAVVERAVVQALALNDWISGKTTGRITRYTVTQSGRSALNRMMAEEESRRAQRQDGFAELQTTYDADDGRRKARYAVSESPLIALSRRRDRDGKPFLAEDLVTAGERLREDFELAQVGSDIGQNWERFLAGGAMFDRSESGVQRLGKSAAQDRVIAALQDLGPGLSDVALRCCCFLEGLEMAEKRLGWSARSGKIVLRIALQRLKRHYAGLSAEDQMIG